MLQRLRIWWIERLNCGISYSISVLFVRQPMRLVNEVESKVCNIDEWWLVGKERFTRLNLPPSCRVHVRTRISTFKFSTRRNRKAISWIWFHGRGWYCRFHFRTGVQSVFLAKQAPLIHFVVHLFLFTDCQRWQKGARPLNCFAIC